MKIKSHILEAMEVEMISWTIYMIMYYQCLVTNYLLNKILIYLYFDLISIDHH
jgi:hypothetical protein